MTRVIVAGSRNFTDYELLERELDLFLQDYDSVTIVSGCARGADRLGERYAIEHDMVVLECPANWEKHGRGAGYKRNYQMAKIGQALIAFWDGESRGTKHMIETARREGLPVKVVRING